MNQDYIVAPNCTSQDNRHRIELIATKPWYAQCAVCGIRFALVAEPVLDALGAVPKERMVIEQ